MHLIIDIGNTNIVFAIYDNYKIVNKWRIATIINRTSDEYLLWLNEIIKSSYEVKNIIIGSVVPDVIMEITNACRAGFGKKIFIVNENLKINFPSDVENKNEVGADRIVNALFAWENYKTASVIIDFGTATTFDVVNSVGTYMGGVICPGINLSLQALHSAAARLPRIAISKPKKVIGNNTVNAMSSGIYWGYVSLIKGVLEKISSELSSNINILATGGLADFFAKEISKEIIINKDLTIHGLYLAYENYGDNL